MKSPTKFICHIHIPKTAGQCIQDAIHESRNIVEDDYSRLHAEFISNPPDTALITKGHAYGSEIYDEYNKGKIKYIHDFKSREYIKDLIQQGHTDHPDATTPFGRDLKTLLEVPDLICLSNIQLEPSPWPGKINKKYWMEVLPDEMAYLGITEHNDIPIMSVVRNPFDRLFSIFSFYVINGPQAYRLQTKPNMTFEDFILSFENLYFRKDNMFGTCFDHLSIENQLLTTDILKFENLANDFKAFTKKYNIPDRELNRVNVNPKKKKMPTYTKKMIKIVERLFEKDLNTFNYSYEQFIKK
jgi:hypothetical protein